MAAAHRLRSGVEGHDAKYVHCHMHIDKARRYAILVTMKYLLLAAQLMQSTPSMWDNARGWWVQYL